MTDPWNLYIGLMKSTCLFPALILFGLMASPEILAQATFGFKGGVNHNTMKIKFTPTVPFGFNVEAPPNATASGLGFHTGLYLNTTGDATAGLLLEVLYSRRSSAYDYDYVLGGVSSYTGRIEYRLEYVEVPILINFKATDELQITFGAAAAIAQAGSFLDVGTMKYSSPQLEFTNTYKDRGSTTKDLTKVVLDVVVGAQFEVLNGFHCGLRYLVDMNNADNSDQTDTKSNVLQFSVAYDIFGRRKE